MRVAVILCLTLFLASAEPIVIDDETGLVWQDNNNTKSMTATWENALSFCRELKLGKYEDWRLPTVKELQSIVDINRTDPAIKPIFSMTSSWAYWSANAVTAYPERAWAVYFYTGHTAYYTKSYYYHVRCVRGEMK